MSVQGDTSLKTILVVVDSVDVQDSSGSKANVALIKNLAAAGYNVRVLHYTRKDIQLRGIECIAIREKKFTLHYFLSRTQRVLQRALSTNFSKFLEENFGFSFTFFNDSHSIAKAIDTFYQGEDLVITLSKGASFRPHHAMLRLPQLHSKWLAYVHDPYPFHCYPPPYEWTEAGHRQKENFFRKVSEKARYAAFPSLMLKEWMAQFFPAFADKSIIIPHQHIIGQSLKGELPAYFDAKKFTVLHAGNLLAYRNPFHIIEAFKSFLKRIPEAKKYTQLLFLGPAMFHEPKFTEICKEVPQIYKSTGYVSFEEVLDVQRNSTVNLLIEAIAEISPFLPGKFPHYVKSNKPIIYIGPKKSESMRLLGENYPYFSHPNDIDQISKIFSDLYFQWRKSPTTLRLDRKDIEFHFSDIALNRVLDKLLIDA